MVEREGGLVEREGGRETGQRDKGTRAPASGGGGRDTFEQKGLAGRRGERVARER